MKERRLLKKVYFNGNFITLEKQNVEAILIENSIIRKVGQKEEIIYKPLKVEKHYLGIKE